MSSAAASWHDVFAGAGARGYRSPALDREALIQLHRNREVARRLERERLGDVLRLGGPALR